MLKELAIASWLSLRLVRDQTQTLKVLESGSVSL